MFQAPLESPASLFHNLGIGWDEKARKFKDEGRLAVSKQKEDTGAFKTPGLREVAKHAPYMHDGSLATPTSPRSSRSSP